MAPVQAPTYFSPVNVYANGEPTGLSLLKAPVRIGRLTVIQIAVGFALGVYVCVWGGVICNGILLEVPCSSATCSPFLSSLPVCGFVEAQASQYLYLKRDI